MGKPFLPREAAARGLLEVSLHRWLRQTLTDSSSGPKKALWEQQLKQVFIQYCLIPLTHPFNENH